MTRRFGSRPTKRDAALIRNASFAYYGMPNRVEVPAERKPRKRTSDPRRPLEKQVLASILAALRADRRVAIVWRMQSGLFQEGDRVIRVGSRGLPDIFALLVGGKLLAIEVKRPGAQATSDQLVALANICAAGGLAGIASSIEEALALLP